ncbi:unnamed protein product [Schistosoma turkestanicum]|nr:unnamed protein product [Schistosoma turkestanicum]
MASSSSSSTTIPGLAFYDSLINNNITESKRLVEIHKIDINARLSHVRKRNHTDLCPVHLVAYKGNLAMLHYLIQNGVNVHQPTCTLQRRPVHYAALRQQVSCLQMLLNAGAQIDARDTFGNTPLHYAAEDGDGGLLSLLLNNGACVDAQDITNKTPLMKAARSGKVWAVRRLLLFGANVNVKDRNDETALHFACRQGSTEITRMLIKAESRLNAQNQIGLTPLMESVSYNKREAVSLLIKQKDIDLYKRDFCTGDTALHIAVKKNYIHIVEILLRAGNWYIEYNYNNLGESFVHDVVAYNRLELLRLFLAYNYDLDRPAKRLPPNIHLLSSTSTSSSASTSTSTSSNYLNLSKSTHTTNMTNNTTIISSDANNRTCLKNPFEKSPFKMALERGHLDMARILAEVGCFCTSLPMNSTSSSSGSSSSSIPSVCASTSSTPTPTSSTSTPTPTSSSTNTNSTEINSIIRNSHLIHQNLLTRRYNGLLEVKSLQKWCRKVIRQYLGFRLIEALPLLPIPVPLKDFLLLRDIDWSIYLNHHHHHAHQQQQQDSNNRSSIINSGELAIIVPI